MPVLGASFALVDEGVLSHASDDELAYTIGVMIQEQKRRALAAGDLEALAEDAFSTWGFDRAGHASVPLLCGGLLICPGFKAEKSAQSHDCGFVSVDGVWVWEHPDVVLDQMRVTAGSRPVRQTVTILPAFEGMTFDVVTSTARSGPCKMREAASFIVQGGVLEPTARRARRPEGHR